MKTFVMITILVGMSFLLISPALAEQKDFDTSTALSSLDHQSERMRRNAAYFLGENGSGDECVKALMAVLDHPDAHLRRIAAHALGKLNDPRPTEALIAMAKDENQPCHVRCAALCSLVRMDCSEALPIIKQIARMEEGWIRNMAIRGLVRMGEIQSVASSN